MNPSTLSQSHAQPTIIRHDEERGGQAYPFLPAALDWQIVSRPLGGEKALAQIFRADPPTLRWVKDDKVLDLVVPGLDTEAFLAETGLRLSMEKGGYVLSKRLSRIMRPYRYWDFFAAGDVTIDYNASLDAALWDGCGQMSRGMVQRLADRLDLDPDDPYRRELLSTERFEVTTLHAAGQDKGHVIVVDDLAVDFMFPAGSAKTELALDGGRVFVGLQPVHGADEICLDIQSVINLHPFFRPEQLLAWAEMESGLFLQGMGNGRLEAVLNRLYSADSPAALAALSDWHVGEYIASGGTLTWFAGMVQAVGKQHLRRLDGRADKVRCPAPGARLYIFPATVGERDVPPGHIELDPKRATAWVNDGDWLEYIVDVLGGCDGDDALWIVPFTDSVDGERKVLAWRSPNQAGEYVLLRPAAESEPVRWAIPGGTLTYPKMDSRLLPPRIDSCHYQYGELAEASDINQSPSGYTVAALESTIIRAAANRGVLGAHCNALMLCRAIYGRLPQRLPATLEAVIDGSVKSGLDLTPVKEWNGMALSRMVARSRRNPKQGIPAALQDRLPAGLRQGARPAEGHWLDTLVMGLERHKAQYWAEVEALAADACPPLAVFEAGRAWMPVGKTLRRVYGRAMRHMLGDGDNEATGESVEAAFNAARRACEAELERWPENRRPYLLLGAAAYLYAQGPEKGAPVRDGLLWQLGAKRAGEGNGRHPGVAQLMLAALREIRLLGEPVWTEDGPDCYYNTATAPDPAGVPIRINGTWINWLHAAGHGPYARMSDVPPALRDRAKGRIADFVQERFQGMVLTTEVTENERLITRTARGNLFGYVQRDHELAAIQHDRWRIAWAAAVDGNVWAILHPDPVLA